jgi:cell division protein FtsL
VGGFKDLFIDVLKLTDEVKRINKTVDQLQAIVNDVDKRVVRLETIVEIAKYHGPKQIENHPE